MKKITSYCSLILLIFTLNSCGGEYLPEKYLYKARMKFKKLDLATATQSEIDDVITAYQIVNKKWPLSRKSSEAHYEIANIYIQQKQFIKARKELENIVINFSNNAELASDAKFAIGQIYEREEDNEQKAIETYKEIYDLYPLTKKGLYCPLYIAEYYKKNNDIDNTTIAYANAIKHYKNRIEELGEIKLSAVLQNYLALYTLFIQKKVGNIQAMEKTMRHPLGAQMFFSHRGHRDFKW